MLHFFELLLSRLEKHTVWYFWLVLVEWILSLHGRNKERSCPLAVVFEASWRHLVEPHDLLGNTLPIHGTLPTPDHLDQLILLAARLQNIDCFCDDGTFHCL